MKTRLRLDAELDLLNKDELAAELDKASNWERQAAFGLKHMALPNMSGTVSGAAVTIGGSQPDQPIVGPKAGWVWKVERVSVYGIAGTTDYLELYKGDPVAGLYVTSIGSGAYHPGKGLILKAGDYLSLQGSGLTSTGTLVVTGEVTQAPAVMIWKLIS